MFFSLSQIGRAPPATHACSVRQPWSGCSFTTTMVGNKSVRGVGAGGVMVLVCGVWRCRSPRHRKALVCRACFKGAAVLKAHKFVFRTHTRGCSQCTQNNTTHDTAHTLPHTSSTQTDSATHKDTDDHDQRERHTHQIQMPTENHQKYYQIRNNFCRLCVDSENYHLSKTK